MIDAKTIRAITFDAGGTLLFPHPNVGSIYAEILHQHQIPLCPTALEEAFLREWKTHLAQPKKDVSHDAEKAWWRHVVGATLGTFGHPPPADSLFEDLWEAFALPQRWRLREGTIEVLQTLRERGYQVAILSNWDHRLRVLLERMNLLGHFDELFISSEVGYEKPDPRIFQKVTERLHLPPQALLHIGDSRHHDADAARAAGWQGLLLANSCTQFQNTEGLTELTDLLLLLPAAK